MLSSTALVELRVTLDSQGTNQALARRFAVRVQHGFPVELLRKVRALTSIRSCCIFSLPWRKRKVREWFSRPKRKKDKQTMGKTTKRRRGCQFGLLHPDGVRHAPGAFAQLVVGLPRPPRKLVLSFDHPNARRGVT
jgi:hypothetical protein